MPLKVHRAASPSAPAWCSYTERGNNPAFVSAVNIVRNLGGFGDTERELSVTINELHSPLARTRAHHPAEYSLRASEPCGGFVSRDT